MTAEEMSCGFGYLNTLFRTEWFWIEAGKYDVLPLDDRMAIGHDMVSPVARDDYGSPFPFSGRIRRVVFDLGDAPAPAPSKSRPAVSWRFIPR